MRNSTIAVCLAVVLSVAASPAQATTITFDNVTNTIEAQAYPSTLYAAEGVTLTSYTLTGDVTAVGQVFTPVLFSNSFGIIDNDNSVSDPNFAVATNVFIQRSGVLMSFSTPVTSVSLQTDDAPGETAQFVRLLALASLGGGAFQVLAISSGLDNETTFPANLLQVAGGPFSFAMFITTTEAEGFNNLNFTPVPEPASLTLIGSGLIGAAWRRRRGRARRS